MIALSSRAADRVSGRVSSPALVRKNLAYRVYEREDQSKDFPKEFVQLAWAAVQEIIAMAGLMFGPCLVLSAFRILVGKEGDVVKLHCDYPVYGAVYSLFDWRVYVLDRGAVFPNDPREGCNPAR
jgi:hypothetical protein